MVQKMYDYLIKDENLYPQKSIPSGWGFLYYSVESVKHLCDIIQNSEKKLVFGSGGFRKGRSAVNVRHMGHP